VDDVADARLTVNFYNNGQSPGNVILYQGPSGGNVLPLVWFTKYVYPQTRVAFTWSTEPCFVWSDTGQLVPGIIASASQTIPADLDTKNAITLTYNQAFNFIDQQPGSRAGTLTVKEDATIPPGMASVGIGMSGQATFLIQAQPNMIGAFTPGSQYWIAFGTYQANQVLEVEQIGTPAQIAFPVNIPAMDATLNADGSWTIQPTHLTQA
jgi:hypothetical protein